MGQVIIVLLLLYLDMWSVQPTTGKKPDGVLYYSFTKVDNQRAVLFGGGQDGLYILNLETWVKRLVQFCRIIIFS